MKPEEVQKFLNEKIGEFKRKALLVVEVEAVKSVKKNFEAGGRPKWIASGKKGKLKGTKTLVVSGTVRTVFASKKHKTVVKQTMSRPHTTTIRARPFLVIPQEDINGMLKKLEKITL